MHTKKSMDEGSFHWLDRHEPPPATAERVDPRTLVIGVEPSWIDGADGTRYELGRAHRRIVAALAELHRGSQGSVLSLRKLLAAGWPGERLVAEAGANRVYVALAQLRRMGLRDLIEHREGGYRLAPDVHVVLLHEG